MIPAADLQILRDLLAAIADTLSTGGCSRDHAEAAMRELRDGIVRLVGECAAREREACAKVCDTAESDHECNARDYEGDGDVEAAVAFRDMAQVCRDAAVSIRARGGQ